MWADDWYWSRMWAERIHRSAFTDLTLLFSADRNKHVYFQRQPPTDSEAINNAVRRPPTNLKQQIIHPQQIRIRIGSQLLDITTYWLFGANIPHQSQYCSANVRLTGRSNERRLKCSHLFQLPTADNVMNKYRWHGPYGSAVGPGNSFARYLLYSTVLHRATLWHGAHEGLGQQMLQQMWCDT